MPTPIQPSLFDDAPAAAATPAPAGAGSAMLKVPGAAASLSKAQKEFNRLSARLTQLRSQLQAWQTAADALQQRRVSEMEPVYRKLLALQRETALWLDAHLQQPPPGEKPAKKARVKLVNLLRLLAREALEAGPDAELEAAHDRHSAQSHREQQREDADMAAAVLGQALGDERLFEGEAASIDELMARTAQRLREQLEAQSAAAGPGAAPPPGRRPDRAQQARQRDAKALQEASQSVRDVYRRLASDLHPDRAGDAAERERKTALMARVNQAYAARDLLALLAMQLELEHIDAAHLAGLPDQRLRHYNRVLKEQQQALEAELGELQMPVALSRQAPPGLLNWPPKLLTLSFDDELQALRAALRALREDAALLRDPRTRAQFLRSVQIDDPDDVLDPLEAMMFEAAFDDLAAVMAPPRGGRRRR